MTNDQNTPDTKTRAPLTPEQREQKNRRDRERRAAQSAAKKQQVRDDLAIAHEASFTGTLGQQQSQRDQPFQKTLDDVLRAQDKARAMRRIREVQK